MKLERYKNGNILQGPSFPPSKHTLDNGIEVTVYYANAIYSDFDDNHRVSLGEMAMGATPDEAWNTAKLRLIRKIDEVKRK